MQAVNLSHWNNFGRTLYFGGGATPPPQAPPPVAPPKPETADNTAAQAAARKRGLQSTMLTGTGLGVSSAGLGASTQTPVKPYTGEA